MQSLQRPHPIDLPYLLWVCGDPYREIHNLGLFRIDLPCWMSSLKAAPTCRYAAVPITIHQAKYLAHTLALRDPDGIGRLSQSLFDAQVDLNPHQIEAALFALQSPLSKGVILADEVGLGKTIEAFETENFLLLTAHLEENGKPTSSLDPETAEKLLNCTCVASQPATTLEEQHRLQEDIRLAEKRKRKARRDIDDIEDDIENQRDQLIASLESRLSQGQTHQTHFSIRFQIKA